MSKSSVYFVLITCTAAAVGGTLTCLSCKDSPLPRDCQYTEKCGPHEVCYSSAYVTTAGTIRHELGCRDINKCSSTVAARSAHNYLTCSQCCNGTLCNSALCGQSGLAPPAARGQICYSCDQQLYPDSCHIIKECSRDEECAENSQQTQNHALVGKRRSITQSDTSNCDIKCCSTDLCNSDCSGSGVISFTNAPFMPTSTRTSATTTQTETTTTATITSTTPTTSTPTSTTPTTTTTTTQAATPCVDVNGYCYLYTATYCSSLWGLQNCRKSCHLCNVDLNTHCIDKTTCNREALRSCNTDWGLNNCIRSCNRC